MTMSVPVSMDLAGAVVATGLVLPPALKFERWQEVGEKLAGIERGRLWWVGDWLLYGEDAYGEEHAQALGPDLYDRQTLYDAKWVAKNIPISRRRENLSWSHHREVAGLQPDEQDKMLDQAADNGWSHRALRAAVQGSKGENAGSKADAVPAAAEPPRVIEVEDEADDAERQLAALRRAWDAAGHEARSAFLEWIDGPLFDSTNAWKANGDDPLRAEFELADKAELAREAAVVAATRREADEAVMARVADPVELAVPNLDPPPRIAEERDYASELGEAAAWAARKVATNPFPQQSDDARRWGAAWNDAWNERAGRMADPDRSEAIAFEMGRLSEGRVAAECPFEFGTAEGAAWEEGWKEARQ